MRHTKRIKHQTSRTEERRRVPLTDFTVVALPAVATDALVNADFVDAGASVATGVALTVINV